MIGFVEQFTPRHVIDAIRGAEPVGPVARHRYPSSQWRHYERMSRFPDGLLVFGDAICSFNPPVYGQGMTVAALEAHALRKCLDAVIPGWHPDSSVHRCGLWGPRGSSPSVRTWRCRRSRGATTVGGSEDRQRYVDRILAAAETDPAVADRFLRISGLYDPPLTLAHPPAGGPGLRGERPAAPVHVERGTIRHVGCARALTPPRASVSDHPDVGSRSRTYRGVMNWSKALGIPAAALAAVASYDLLQRRHALLRNFPVVGHGRYLLESVGPELRQYIITRNDEERPFTRDQRHWVYAVSKRENDTFGFGTDNDIEFTDGYTIIKHRTFSRIPPSGGAPHHGEGLKIPSAKILGGPRGGRAKAFRPDSFVNVSAMSFGSLSAAAVVALNQGAAAAGCLHNTGEGGLSRYHRNGADLIFQIGTAYFGCRDGEGRFDLGRLVALTESRR